MAITEAQRHAMHAALRKTLGREEADTLMAYLPPVGWADIATRQDLASLASELRAEIHKSARSQLIVFLSSMTLIVGALNAGLFAVLRLT